MEEKSTDSVICMLMGLDKFQHQQPSSEKYIVLSQDYIRNSASICRRSGSLVCRTKNEVVPAAKDVSGVQILNGKNDNAVAQCNNSTSTYENEGVRCRNPIDASISGSLLGSRYLDNLAYLSRTDCCDPDNARRYLQRLEYDLNEDYLGQLDNMNNALKAKLEMMDKRYRSGCIGQRKSLRKKSMPEFTFKETVGTSIVSPTIRCWICQQNKYKTSQQAAKKSKFKDPFMFSCRDLNSNLLHSLQQSSLSNDSRWQSHGNGVTAKEAKGLGVSGRDQAFDEMHTLVPKSFNTELGGYVPSILSSAQSRSSGSSSPSICSSMYSSDDAQYTGNDTYNSLDAFSTEVCSRISGEAESESNRGLLMETVDSHLQDVFSIEVPLEELSESDGRSGHPFCSRLNPSSSQEQLEKAYHRPLDSVLESLDIQNSNRSTGIRLHPDALNFEPKEILCTGVVTGNEEPEEWFDCLSNGSTNLERLLGDDQKRNFSYLVDILDEAGYCRTKPFIDPTRWHSPERPLSPLVFEAVEETCDKHNLQKSWQKSERRLLFDSINSALMDIFNPLLNFQAFETPAKLSLLASLRRDEIEDRLWTMLSKQEDEKDNELLEKWLVYEEGMDMICRELEASLFDELVIGW